MSNQKCNSSYKFTLLLYGNIAHRTSFFWCKVYTAQCRHQVHWVRQFLRLSLICDQYCTRRLTSLIHLPACRAHVLVALCVLDCLVAIQEHACGHNVRLSMAVLGGLPRYAYGSDMTSLKIRMNNLNDTCARQSAAPFYSRYGPITHDVGFCFGNLAFMSVIPFTDFYRHICSDSLLVITSPFRTLHIAGEYRLIVHK